jgi:hypothetical protein
MEDLKKLKFKNWKETAQGRRTWRDLVEKAKTHRVVVPNDDDDDDDGGGGDDDDDDDNDETINTTYVVINLKFAKSEHHHTIQIYQPTKCENFSRTA